MNEELYKNTWTVSKDNVLSAIGYIDKNSVPASRMGRSTSLIYNGKRYPCKYTVEIAIKFNPKNKDTRDILPRDHITHDAARLLDKLGFGGDNFGIALKR